MDVLIADDDPIYRRLLEAKLHGCGYHVHLTADGDAAWAHLEHGPAALLAILDWSMPGRDGPELCRLIRRLPEERQVYVILLTARTGRDDVITGLGAGADDYISKPFDHEELLARIQVGVRVLRLQQSLAAHVRKLKEALASVRHLQGLLPMCSYCKCIRNDENYWQQVEHYLADHSELQFSHGICPGCYTKVVEPQLEALRRTRNTECGVPSAE